MVPCQDSEPLGSGCMAQVYKGRLSGLAPGSSEATRHACETMKAPMRFGTEGPLCRDQKARASG